MTGTSQTGRLLSALKRQKSLTNRQIVSQLNILRYSARIAELRQEGHIVECVRVHDGLFRYYYRGHRDEEESTQSLGVYQRMWAALRGRA